MAKKKGRLDKNVNLSVKLYRKRFRVIPRIIWTIDRIVFAADIPYQADIDETVHWGHNGLGTVVNGSSAIGPKTTIMQGVTLGGSLGATREYDGRIIESPQIGKHCLIGAGAILIGPIVLGDDVIIGAGSVVTNDIPSGNVAVGSPARVIRKANEQELKEY